MQKYSTHIIMKDDFDLYKIIHSGQCFRAVEFEKDTFRFITGSRVLYIHHSKGMHYTISCSRYLWNHFWKPYFDGTACYEEIRNSVPEEDSFLSQAAAYSRGIRILRQAPWETMITFIISQRKSIPAIHTSVEKLCSKAGKKIETPYEVLYTFPSAENLAALSADDLKNCSLGYRSPYIAKTAAIIKNRHIF